MTAMLALASSFAFESLHYEEEASLFASSEGDASNAPLFCCRCITYSVAPYLASHGDLTTKLFRLFSQVPTFQFVSRIVAAPGRMCAHDISLITRSFRGLKLIDLSDCIPDPASDISAKLRDERYSLKKAERCSLEEARVAKREALCGPLSPLKHLPLLHTLVLSSCPGVDDIVLTEVVSRIPSLVVLDISCCENVSHVGVSALAERLPKLTALSLSGMSFPFVHRAVHASYFFGAPPAPQQQREQSLCMRGLSKAAQLIELDLSLITDLTKADLMELVLPRLGKFSIAGCDDVTVDSELVDHFVKNCLYLIEANISRCKAATPEQMLQRVLPGFSKARFFERVECSGYKIGYEDAVQFEAVNGFRLDGIRFSNN